ncbi:MAG TPA: alpha-E domain-containing protein [Acidimicrobiales bacterium]
MLLSRVADNLYWAARYLERAEDTARVLREHTNLLVDLPTSVPVTWEPLLAVTGSKVQFEATFERADEHAIVRWLVAERANAGSILMSVENARENLRTTREVLPREVWQAVNDLYLHVASHNAEGVSRRSRGRFCERVIGECQRIAGILDGTMSRDEAADMWRLGCSIERADMTTRVIDVRCGSIIESRSAVVDTYDDVQWMSVLRSLSALQMYHRSTRRAVAGPSTLRFLLRDEQFPRSIACCLREVGLAISQLPPQQVAYEALAAARNELQRVPVDDLDVTGLHDAMDRLQISIGSLHDAVAASFFMAIGPG